MERLEELKKQGYDFDDEGDSFEDIGLFDNQVTIDDLTEEEDI